jgi:hypothetical protein
MHKRDLLALASTAILFGSVQAQATVPITQAQVDALPLDQICSKTSVLGFPFGTSDYGTVYATLPGQAQRYLAGTLRPIDQATLRATKYSNKLFMAEYQLPFATDAEAKTALTSLSTRAEKAGWFPWADVVAKDAGDEIYTTKDPNSSWYYSTNAIQEPTSPDETMFQFDRRGKTLSITCENMALSDVHAQEALGQMPAGTPKPILADFQEQPLFPISDCDDPALRTAHVDALKNGDDSSIMPGAVRVAYEERLSDWKIMKLVSSGKISHEAIADKIIGLINGPESLASMQAGMGMIKDMMKLMEGLKPDDDVGICKAIHSLAQKGQKAVAPVSGATGDAVTPQWRATHALLDSEAKRLGVTFE